jgi:1-acyl-sn-glycerol-3-phosphate acyltransferase
MSVGQLYRVLATGLSFALFGVGGMVLGVVAGLFLRVIIHDPVTAGQLARRLVSHSFSLFVHFMSWAGVLRWRVEGVPPACAGLVIANHPTLIDVVFLLAIFRGADCVVKDSVLRNPFWGALVRRAGYVSNADIESLIDACVARLRAGRTVILFPEGTRTSPGEALNFGPVAAMVAMRAGVPCLPVAITCAPITLYKGCPWYRVPAQRARFVLRHCPPIAPPVLPDDRQGQRQMAREFSRQLQSSFNEHLQAV